MAGVVLDGVTREFAAGVTAVKSLDLTVRDGEFVVLVGPSGCGKSTTLRMIAGLEEVTQGEIRIGPTTVNTIAPKDRDIAMVFQNYALYPHMSVYRNLAFGLELRLGATWLARVVRRVKKPWDSSASRDVKAEIDRRVRWAAGILGIDGLLDRMPRQLSGGERQRVALGRAMVRRPAAFLFDEPLSNLDAKLRVEMRRELKQLHRQLEATMLYVTHDQVEALTLGDRVAVMHEGELQQFDSPQVIYDHPSNRFVAGFIGSPPMNLVRCRWDKDGSGVLAAPGLRVPLDRLPPRFLDLPAEPQVDVGIRPEHVTIDPVKATDGATSETDLLRVGTGVVVEIEPVGDATYVQVQCSEGDEGSTYLTSKIPSDVGVTTGAKVGVFFGAQRMHLFSGKTGANLFPRRPAENN